MACTYFTISKTSWFSRRTRTGAPCWPRQGPPFISVASSWPSPRSSPARSRDAPGTSTDPSCHRVRSPGVTVLRCSHPGARATGVRPRSRLRRRSAQPAAGGRSGGRPDRATGRSARGAEPVVGLDAVPLHEQDEPGPGLHALRHAHRPAAGLEPTSVRASAYAARKAVSAPGADVDQGDLEDYARHRGTTESGRCRGSPPPGA